MYKEIKPTMNYKAIVLYSISKYELREMFTKALSDMHFIEHPDQSTYTLPVSQDGEIFDISVFHTWFSEWSMERTWSKDDFVSVFYLDRNNEGSGLYTIKNKHYPTREK